MPRSDTSVGHSGGKSRDRSNLKISNDQSRGAQQTISELFATSKHKCTAQEAEDLIASSPSKRLKREHTSLAADNTIPSARTMQREEMYSSFPSTNARKPEIIELSDDDTPVKLSPLRNKPYGIVRPKNVTPQAGLKKLVVKNLRKTPRTDPDQYYNHVWNQLDTALSAIFADEKVPFSMEELYRGVEILCRQDRAPSLYKKLCEKCKQVSIRMQQPLVTATANSNNIDVLQVVVEARLAWTTHMVDPTMLTVGCLLTFSGYCAFDILLLGPFLPSTFSVIALDRGHGRRRIPYTYLLECHCKVASITRGLRYCQYGQTGKHGLR